MQQLNIVLVTIGGMVLVLGLLSRPLKRTIFSAPLLALILGVVIGPLGLGLLHPTQWGRLEIILEEAARLTIAIGLMGVALRLPRGFPLRHWRSLAVLLAAGMPLMWLSSGLLAYWLLDLPLLVALLLGAVVCATDPIVATSIVTGEVAEKNLPKRLRHLLSAESGANDGLAYALVLLPILLLTQSPDDAWPTWLGRILLWEVGAAALVGALLGFVSAHLLKWAEARHDIDQHSFLAFTLALTLFALGAANLLGTDGILAVFVAGVTLDQVANASERRQEERVQEAVNQFFTLPIFTFLGLVLPWDQWRALGWTGLALVVAVLLLRRLPVLLILKRWIPELQGTRDALFLGWFGPIGVAALFYSMLSLRQTGHEIVWTLGSLLICASLVVHGVTAAPFTKRYGRDGRAKAEAGE